MGSGSAPPPEAGRGGGGVKAMPQAPRAQRGPARPPPGLAGCQRLPVPPSLLGGLQGAAALVKALLAARCRRAVPRAGPRGAAGLGAGAEEAALGPLCRAAVGSWRRSAAALKGRGARGSPEACVWPGGVRQRLRALPSRSSLPPHAAGR